MILTESRMRENRTSGLTSGGEETQRGTRLRHRRVAKAAGNSDSLDLRPARLPSTLLTQPRVATSPGYFQVTSMAKKWSNTSRLGILASLVSGLRM